MEEVGALARRNVLRRTAPLPRRLRIAAFLPQTHHEEMLGAVGHLQGVKNKKMLLDFEKHRSRAASETRSG